MYTHIYIHICMLYLHLCFKGLLSVYFETSSLGLRLNLHAPGVRDARGKRGRLRVKIYEPFLLICIVKLFKWFLCSLVVYSSQILFLIFVFYIIAEYSPSYVRISIFVIYKYIEHVLSLTSHDCSIFILCMTYQCIMSYMVSLFKNRIISNHITSFWANYNNSLTWIKAVWGWFPLLTMISSEVVVKSL